MPTKSRHGRGKHPSRRKKSKMRHGASPVVAQRQAIAQPEVPASPIKVLTPTTTLTAARYPYVAAELRRIGILAGIILAVLVVLVLVLS